MCLFYDSLRLSSLHRFTVLFSIILVTHISYRGFVASTPVSALHKYLLPRQDVFDESNKLLIGGDPTLGFAGSNTEINNGQPITWLGANPVSELTHPSDNSEIASASILDGLTGSNNPYYFGSEKESSDQSSLGDLTGLADLAASGNQMKASFSPDPQNANLAQALEKLDTSDYPSNADIQKAFRSVGRDKSVMFSEVGGFVAAKAFAQMNSKYIYEDLYPVDYTLRHGRSTKWFSDFTDRFSFIFAVESSGDVFLISKWPSGPCSKRSVWARIELPALQANADVTSIILVDYENFSRQKAIWQRGQKRDLHRRFPSAEDESCFGKTQGSSAPPQEEDLTPILGASAGWARVYVVQHRKKNPTAHYRLDLSIKNARNVQIGHMENADAPEGVEVRLTSLVPYALRVVTQRQENDPLLFRYGNDVWDSNDQSPSHQCNASPWQPDETRTANCIFTY